MRNRSCSSAPDRRRSAGPGPPRLRPTPGARGTVGPSVRSTERRSGVPTGASGGTRRTVAARTRSLAWAPVHRIRCIPLAILTQRRQVPVPKRVAVHLSASALTFLAGRRGDRLLPLPSSGAKTAHQLTAAIAVLCRRRPFTGPSASGPGNTHMAEGLALLQPSTDNPLGSRRGRQVESAGSTREP